MAWIFSRFSIVLLLFCFNIAHAGILDSLTNSLSNAEPKFLPVSEAFPFQIDQQGDQLQVIWDSADEYYLYKKTIFLQQDQQPFLPSFLSQDGLLKHDEAFGEVLVFYDQLEAKFDLNQLPKNTPLQLEFQGCADAGLCYPPQKIDLKIDWSLVQSQSQNTASLNKNHSSASTNTVTETIDTNTNSDSWIAGKPWISVVGLFFILGLGLTFTPCVLPMVPILTSIVIGQHKHTPSKGFVLSTTYVLGMAITYAIAGITVGLLGAGANIQAWMQTPWILTLFAVLFLALSLSMFGLYELQLPSALRNRLNAINQKQKGGNLISVFLMGVLSALVVSPCVSAPLAGALVYLSTTGDAWLGGSALLALGLGMGTPLIILGTSGASIMPKAGEWMNQIKIFFGVLLIGVAIWLLSRFLEASLTLAFWGILAILYGIYLGAIDNVSSKDQAENTVYPEKRRALKGIAFVIFLYGILAFIGALQGNGDPLKPLASNIMHDANIITSSNTKDNISPFTTIHNKDQLNAAIKTHLVAHPDGAIMLDYYADWCISCKVMEKEVFHHFDVQNHWPQLLWLQVDVTKQTPDQIQLMTDFNLFGPPSLIFFTRTGEQKQHRILGELNKEDFINHLNKVKSTL